MGLAGTQGARVVSVPSLVSIRKIIRREELKASPDVCLSVCLSENAAPVSSLRDLQPCHLGILALQAPEGCFREALVESGIPSSIFAVE